MDTRYIVQVVYLPPNINIYCLMNFIYNTEPTLEAIQKDINFVNTKVDCDNSKTFARLYIEKKIIRTEFIREYKINAV